MHHLLITKIICMSYPKAKILNINSLNLDANCNIYPGKDYIITLRSSRIESYWMDLLRKNIVLKESLKNKHFLDQKKFLANLK